MTRFSTLSVVQFSFLETVHLSPLGGMDNHNLILHLKSEHTLYQMYGMRKQYRAIALYVDNKEAFAAQLIESASR